MSRFPLVFARTGTVLIALGAFWLSFTALRDLAIRSGVPESQAWVWPLIVDGLVLVATVAAIDLERHRWYPWTLLATGAAISLIGNGLHATYTGELPVAVRILVAAVAPLSVLASVHLCVLLARPHNAPSIDSSHATTTVSVAPLITSARHDDAEVTDLGASFRAARKAATLREAI